MAEDWNAIAAEVDAAIRSVADVGQPGGYPCTLETPPAGGPGSPWDPPGGAATYATVYCIEGYREIRDAAGATVIQVQRTLMVSAIGVAPTKGQRIALGVLADQLDFTDSPLWHEIVEVRPTSPAGIAVLFELDIAT